MKAIIVHLWKSFWLSKIKLALCILAATLSAWGISTIIYGYLMTERDFVQNFEQSNPANIVLTLEKPSADLLRKLKSVEGVLEIERREAVAARIKSISGSWMPLIIFGAESMDKSAISKFKLVDVKNQSPTSLYIEQSGKGFIDASVDSLAIQIPGFENILIPFGGLTHDPGQAPSQMEQALYGFTLVKNLQPYLKGIRERYIVRVRPELVNQEKLEAISRALTTQAKQAGVGADAVIPPPGEHPHQGIVDGISFLQESFGIILSLLGAILLSLILITWIYPQIVNIGIMKAIGASGSMIFSAYSLVLLLIISLGLLMGLPLGYKAGMLYSGSVAFIQNFIPIREPLPFVNHLVVIFPVIIIPVFFSFIPLWKSSKTTVQNSLNQVFYTPYKAVFKLTQSFISNNVVKYSLNNLFRSSQRTGLLFILLAAGIALFSAGSSLKYSLQKDFYGYAEDAGYDAALVFKDTMRTRLSFIEELPYVEKTTYVRLKAVQFKLSNHVHEEEAAIRILPPEYTFEKVRIVKGELKRDCANCLYVTQQFEKEFDHLPLGSMIELSYSDLTKEQFIYSGVIKDLSHPGFYRFDTTPTTLYNEVVVKIKDGFSAQDAARLIDDILLENDIDIRQITDVRTRLLALENHLAPMFLVIQLMGIGTVVIALAGLMIVLRLSMQERAREMGIMKALGGSVNSIVNAYQIEYLVITFFSILMGIIVGHFLNSGICSLFGIMVTRSPVPPLIDFKSIAFSIVLLLFVQMLLIGLYVRYRVTRTSSRLLSDVF